MLAQFDATRDLRGTFYVLDDWKLKHEELRVELENRLGVDLADNGNSFRSCFQFVEKKKPGQVHRRVKVYNKLLMFLQSETVQKGIGMNLRSVFYSNAKMYKALREACEDGLTRVEISYYAADHQQEQQLFDEDRLDRYEVDLNLATEALCKVEGICHEVPMATLFEQFQLEAKKSQMFV